VPSAVWIVDTKKEHIAVGEARKLNIPVVAILDTNCDPDEVDYPIPGNDDAIRSAALLTRVVAQACADGLQARGQRNGGGDGERGEDEPLAEWEQELMASGGDGASAPTGLEQGSTSSAVDAPGDSPVATPEAEATAAAAGDDTTPVSRPERTAGTVDANSESDDNAIAAAPEAGQVNGTPQG